MLLFFFFNDTATTEIYTLSLHDALPISPRPVGLGRRLLLGARLVGVLLGRLEEPAHLLAQLRRVLVPVHRDGMLGGRARDLVLLADDRQRAVAVAGKAAAVGHHSRHARTSLGVAPILALRRWRVNPRGARGTPSPARRSRRRHEPARRGHGR